MSTKQKKTIKEYLCPKATSCSACPMNLPKGVNGIFNCASIALKDGKFELVKQYKIDMRRVR